MVRIRWFPALEPVECLPFPSKINSLDWSSHPWLASGVGEVFGAARPYNGKAALPYARGLTPCAPAETFKRGEVLDVGAPPQEYNADGFPLCCLNIFTAEGGLEWSGEAAIVLLGTGPSCLTAVELVFEGEGIPLEGWMMSFPISGGLVALGVAKSTWPGPIFVELLETNAPPGAFPTFVAWNGSCASSDWFADMDPGDSVLMPLPTTGAHYFSVSNDTEVAYLWRVRLTPQF